jgi:hypothetical protein
MRNGSRLRLCFLASQAIRVAVARITAALSKRFFGLRAPALLGEIWHTEFGRWDSVFRRFRRWAVKGVFEILSRHYPAIRISNTP